MSDDMKIVIILKENRGSIGVQAPGCDPVLQTFEGDLTVALQRVSGVVEVARRRWDSNPLYPKCETPLPSQAPVPTTRTRQEAATAAESTPQQRFF